MPVYRVTALERHLYVCTYNEVEADSPEEAEEAVRDGLVAYDARTVADHPNQVAAILSVKVAGGGLRKFRVSYRIVSLDDHKVVSEGDITLDAASEKDATDKVVALVEKEDPYFDDRITPSVEIAHIEELLPEDGWEVGEADQEDGDEPTP